MDTEFDRKFLKDRDDTGRFIVTSLRTGRRYYVEPTGDPRTNWGSIKPGSKPGDDLATKKGWQKYRGAIDEKDSLITEENGFENIHFAGIGVSPEAYIDMLDAKHPDKNPA